MHEFVELEDQTEQGDAHALVELLKIAVGSTEHRFYERRAKEYLAAHGVQVAA
jgi:hypothetical protein